MRPLRQLHRRYDRLRIWERIPLLLAARGRKDDAEYDRLIQASRPVEWKLPEHLMDEHALHLVTMMFIQQQMEAASHFFLAMWIWSEPDEETTEEQADMRNYVIDSLNHFYAANARGWERFCNGLGVDPVALVEGNRVVGRQSAYAAKLLETAPNEAEFLARAAARGEDETAMTTASRAKFWRRLLRRMTRDCPVPEIMLR